MSDLTKEQKQLLEEAGELIVGGRLYVSKGATAPPKKPGALPAPNVSYWDQGPTGLLQSGLSKAASFYRKDGQAAAVADADNDESPQPGVPQ